ncbi:hypothetical protein ACFQL1_04475 [Halomicroarcula sp. GCM10025709]|uniref:hypothetical protein n=1 Tax=Halomicroarcula sp. GCM10025709 TaxID=3252669 RepID=UPI00361D14D8
MGLPVVGLPVERHRRDDDIDIFRDEPLDRRLVARRGVDAGEVEVAIRALRATSDAAAVPWLFRPPFSTPSPGENERAATTWPSSPGWSGSKPVTSTTPTLTPSPVMPAVCIRSMSEPRVGDRGVVSGGGGSSVTEGSATEVPATRVPPAVARTPIVPTRRATTAVSARRVVRDDTGLCYP